MEARRERLARISQDLREAKASTGRIDGRKVLVDLEWLLVNGPLEATPEPEARARVWRGNDHYNAIHWWWTPDGRCWEADPCQWLRNGDIFVAGNLPRPTEAPQHLSLLPECTEVDWG